jgi:hypothetical protein
VVVVASVALAAEASAAAESAANGKPPAMRAFLTFMLVLTGVSAYAKGIAPASLQKRYYDTIVAERGWVIRGAYHRQELTNWAEFGFGRMARLQHYNQFGKGTPSAAASFTFGADFSYDTSAIVAPKLAVEFSSILLGGRVSYGYYMQDHNRSGVICVEGGINVLSTVFVYLGYNFVKGNSDTPVIPEGMRISVGLNYPLGMRRVPPPKTPTHL